MPGGIKSGFLSSAKAVLSVYAETCGFNGISSLLGLFRCLLSRTGLSTLNLLTARMIAPIAPATMRVEPAAKRMYSHGPLPLSSEGPVDRLSSFRPGAGRVFTWNKFDGFDQPRKGEKFVLVNGSSFFILYIGR